MPPKGPAGESSPRPEALRVEELQRVAALDPEQERIRGEHHRRDRKAGEIPAVVRRAPRHQRERGEQCDRHGARQQCEAARDAGAEEAAPLGEEERGDAQQQIERLAVDRLQEEGHREEREVENGAPCSLGSQPSLGQAVEQDEGAEARRERHEDPGQHVMAEEEPSEQAHSGRVEREEGGRRAGQVLVAVLGDAQEEDAVPAGPDVREGAEVTRDGGIVPTAGERMPVRLEDEEREESGQPRSRRGSRRRSRRPGCATRGGRAARSPRCVAPAAVDPRSRPPDHTGVDARVLHS